MAKPKNHSWFKMKWDLWRNDPQLRRCCKETRGFWIDAIAVMEEVDQYFVEGTIEELCRDIVCTRDEFDRSVAELLRTDAATVLVRVGRQFVASFSPNRVLTLKSQTIVKIISRKILKDVNLTEYNKLKKRESRERQRVKKKSISSQESPLKNREEREERFKTPLPPNGQKPDGSGTDFKPSEPESEIGIWMTAVATACGAKSVGTLSKRDRWATVVQTAVREDRDLSQMLSVITEERKRLGADTQFFTPEQCLQKLQMLGRTKHSTVVAESTLPTLEEKIRGEEEYRRNAKLVPPPINQEGNYAA